MIDSQMKNPALYSLLIIVALSLLCACDGDAPHTGSPDKNAYKEPLMEANRHIVRTENQHIEDFLRRYKWDMKESGSGLRYMIYEEGNGLPAKKGMLATISYTIKVITGDMAYSSQEDGPLTFIVGNGEVISGLEEGILLLNVGDKAKFIIPSHLAYGLVGDGNLIPAKTTLIYEIELLNLKQPIN